MAIVRVAEDVESGVAVGAAGGGGAVVDVTEPLLQQCRRKEDDDDEAAESKIRDKEAGCGDADGGGSLRMVLLSTAVAVCGSFEFGTCVRGLRCPN